MGSKLATGPTLPGANPAITAGAPAATPAVLPAASASATAAATGKLKTSERIAQREALAAANEQLRVSEAAQAAEAAKAAKAAESAGKTAKALGFLSRGLGAIGVLGSAYYAKEEFGQGKNVTGTLSALSATTGALAIGAGMTGAGLPAAAVLGGISAFLGVASALSGQFESGNGGARPEGDTHAQTSGQPTPAVKQTNPGGNLRSAGSLQDVKGVIYHHTGGSSLDGAIRTLRDTGYSYNYIIDKDGKIHRLLPEGQAANHGGAMQSGFTNRNTIGVSMVAQNDSAVTPQQVAAAKALHQQLAAKYGFDASSAHGHGQVSPGRKQATEGMAAVNAIKGASVAGTSMASASAPEISESLMSVQPSNVSGPRANDAAKTETSEQDLLREFLDKITTGNILNIDQSNKSVTSSASGGGGGGGSWQVGINDTSVQRTTSSVAWQA